MRKLWIAVFALLLAAGSTQAQKVPTAGTRAIIFEFQGLDSLGLGAFQGGVGLRYYLQDNLALRPFVNFSIASRTTEVDTPGVPDVKTSSSDIGLGLVGELRLPWIQRVAPYLGGGAQFTRGAEDRGATEITKMTLGLFAAAGFEWFFVDAISLGGEYRLGLNRNSKETEVAGGATTTVTETQISFDTASLFLSVTW